MSIAYSNWTQSTKAFPNTTDVGIKNINGTKVILYTLSATTDVDVICLGEEPA